MKSYISLPIILLLLSLTATVAVAQEQPKKDDGKQQVEEVQQDASTGPGFIDEDGDGINDRKQAAGQSDDQSDRRQVRNRRRDHFIDTDGDGINDERCNGLGIHRGARRGQQKGGGQ